MVEGAGYFAPRWCYVIAFGVGSPTFDRLVQINDLMRHKGRLDGPLKPLAAGVSNELYRRRTGRGWMLTKESVPHPSTTAQTSFRR